MIKFITRVGTIGLVAIAAPVFAQDALFVDSAGYVGVGTNTPSARVHVLRSDGTAQVLVQETNSTESIRSLFQLENKGTQRFVLSTHPVVGLWTFASWASTMILPLVTRAQAGRNCG